MAQPAYRRVERKRRELLRCTAEALCPNEAHFRCGQCGRRFCASHVGYLRDGERSCPFRTCGASWSLIAESKVF